MLCIYDVHHQVINHSLTPDVALLTFEGMTNTLPYIAHHNIKFLIKPLLGKFKCKLSFDHPIYFILVIVASPFIYNYQLRKQIANPRS